MERDKKILFCWSGGGLPGLSIHVGIWKALEEKGVKSTHNIGTSAGSVIAAVNSSGRSVANTESILRDLKNEDLRKDVFCWRLRFVFGKLNHFIKPAPIQKLLRRLLPPVFSELHKPLIVCATDEESGESVQCSKGGLYEALLASMAIPGVFPPVEVGGTSSLLASDGGTSAYLPVHPDWREFDEIYLLIAARPLNYKGRGGLGRFLYTADLMIHNQVRDTIRDLVDSNDVNGPAIKIIWPQAEAAHGSLKMDQSLINLAYLQTLQMLERENDGH